MEVLEQTSGWRTEVERGPDWLFVRVIPPSGGEATTFPLAECVWDLMRSHFATRVVLELDQLPILRSAVIGEIVLLHKRVHTQGGIMRIAGLSDANQSVLRMMRLDERFPHFRDRYEAVSCTAVENLRSPKPR